MNHILFPITYECNLSCAGCCNKDTKVSVNIEQSLKSIKLQSGKVDWVFITGGEPFIVYNLFDICDILKTFGFKVGVTTNGTFYKPDIAKHVDRVGISIDGTKEYHDSYRGEGVFDKAIKLFYSIKDQCETVIMSVAFKENIEELKKVSTFIKELNPTYWQIQRNIYDPAMIVPSF